MRAVVAVLNLTLAPKFIDVWVREIIREVRVVVHAWIEEPIPMNIQPDTTPPWSYFDQVRCSYINQQLGHTEPTNQSDRLTVDFDTLFDIWLKTPNGPEKEKIEKVIHNSPLFKERWGISPPGPTTQMEIEGSSHAPPEEKAKEIKNELKMSSPIKNGRSGDLVQHHNNINGSTAIVLFNDTDQTVGTDLFSVTQTAARPFLGRSHRISENPGRRSRISEKSSYGSLCRRLLLRTPRRSRRISEKSGQLTYTPKKTRHKRDLNDVSSPTAVNSPAKMGPSL